MSRRVQKLAAAAFAGLIGVAGCNNRPAAPTGQVIATVDGAEVTVTELNQELNGFRTSDAKAYSLAKQRALQNIIARKLVAKQARAQHLDQTPDFTVKQQKSNELLLAEAFQAKIVSGVPSATPEEADRFVADHPDMFSARKLFSLDQITTPPLSSRVQQELRPINTLSEAEALLTREHVQFRRGTAEVDALSVGPQLVEAFVKQGATDIIIVPSAQNWTINQVKSSRVEPFTGENARKYAIAAITNERQRQVLSKTFGQVVSSGSGNVTYAKGYEPPVAAATQTPKTATTSVKK